MQRSQIVGAGAVTVAVLFARSDSIYKSMPECDVWDIERDARYLNASKLETIQFAVTAQWRVFLEFSDDRVTNVSIKIEYTGP